MTLDVLFSVVILIFSIVLHEYAHGYTAFLLGDPTAKQSGRLTLNPIKHIDLVGTILLPIVLILLKSPFLLAMAKPVPVNFLRLGHPKRDMLWVGLAGPMTNLILAVVFSRFLFLPFSDQVLSLLGTAVVINLALAIFNSIPIPPLDGSRVVMALLPNKLALNYARVERYGILIVFGLFYIGLLDSVVLPAIIFLSSMLGVHLT